MVSLRIVSATNWHLYQHNKPIVVQDGSLISSDEEDSLCLVIKLF